MMFRKSVEDEPIWTVQLPHSIYGSLSPVHDPLTESLLVCDGWGTSYSSIKLRRLDLATGNEIAAVRTGNVVRLALLHSERQSILAILDCRLALLDRATLSKLREWKQRVPRYASGAALGDGKVALMTWMGPQLSVYNLDTVSAARKPVGSCTAMFNWGTDEVMICSGKEGLVSTYSFKTKVVSAVLHTPQFQSAQYIEGMGILAVALGNPFEVRPQSCEHFRNSTRLRLYSLSNSEARDITLPNRIRSFKMHPSATQLYLDEGNAIAVCDISDHGLVNCRRIRLPSDGTVRQMIPERGLAIVGTEVGRRTQLACYSAS